MSSDKAVLMALETKTEAELRYFELVCLRFTGEEHQCFCGVGRHGLYFLRRNLSGLYPDKEGGEVLFAHVDRLLEDSSGTTDLLVVMNSNRSSAWASENIFIVSETRSQLINHIMIAWQTSYTWRFGEVKALPCIKHALRSEKQKGMLQVHPWKGFKRVSTNGYFMFIPGETSDDKPDSKYDTKNPVQEGMGLTYKDAERELELTVLIQPQVNLIDLEMVGHDHIRWVAMDYKQHLAEQYPQATVIRNAFYLKKMNIANDLASWSGWELLMKSETHVLACVLFRRLYCPPILDTCQDMSVTVKAPLHVVNEGKISDQELMLEAHLIADSMSPLVKNCTQYPNLYRDVIQAKLDSLLFNEDATKWINDMLGLKPKSAAAASEFIKSILKMLQDENALSMPDLIAKVEGTAHPEPMHIARHDLKETLEIFEPDDANLTRHERHAENTAAPSTRNAYFTRLARYFASVLDGGLLGSDFTLQDVTSAFLITHVSCVKRDEIVHFLLHIRPKNMELEYSSMSIKQLLEAANFHDYIFNDRVMQALLELDWVEKQLASEEAIQEWESRQMSKPFAKFLALLLVSKTVSTSLKAAICRKIISAQQNSPHYSTLIPALMDTMVQGNLYLTTYCTVTLVNLSRGQELVKNMLVSRGIPGICVEQLKSTDDDLIQYTLVLLTNITKSMHHRDAINRYGLGQVLIDLLINSYAKPDKKKVLTELSSVIGQLCNDEDTRKAMSGPETSTVQLLLVVFIKTAVGPLTQITMRLKSKVMFALKQICVNNNKDKDKVGDKLIEQIIHDLDVLADDPATLDFDYSMNAILLLLLLSLSPVNCRLMKEYKINDLMTKLMMTKLWSVESAREKLNQLSDRVAHASHLEIADQ